MKNFKIFSRYILVFAVILVSLLLIKIFPRYVNPYSNISNSENISLIIGVKNESDRILDDIIIKDDKILFSFDNMKRFIDSNIVMDEKYDQIITTSKTSVKVIDYKKSLMREYLEKDSEPIYIETIKDKMYFDLVELEKIYGIECSYIKETNSVVILKDIHTYKIGTTISNVNMKVLPSIISGKIDTIKNNSQVYIIQTDGVYYKVRDEYARYGYILKDKISNINNVTNFIDKNVFDGKINMVWDYVNITTPDRTNEEKINSLNVVSPTWIDLENEQADVIDKTDKKYVTWANKNGYDIWVLFTNNSKIKTTSIIMKDSKLREKLIKDTLDICIEHGFDGINVDFENMYKEDIDLYSQFIRELAVSFNSHGIIVSVDVTVPDGSDTWSLCYDRAALGNAANYVVLMAYDQTPVSSKVPGSVAAINWVESNINKLLKEVDKEKLILGMPLYTRIWKTDKSGETTSATIDMKNISSYLVKNNLKANWNEELGQNFVKYSVGSNEYSIWIEDMKSVEEKLKVFAKYDLAGIALWEKDREVSGIWNLIEKYMNK